MLLLNLLIAILPLGASCFGKHHHHKSSRNTTTFIGHVNLTPEPPAHFSTQLGNIITRTYDPVKGTHDVRSGDEPFHNTAAPVTPSCTESADLPKPSESERPFLCNRDPGLDRIDIYRSKVDPSPLQKWPSYEIPSTGKHYPKEFTGFGNQSPLNKDYCNRPGVKRLEMPIFSNGTEFNWTLYNYLSEQGKSLTNPGPVRAIYVSEDDGCNYLCDIVVHPHRIGGGNRFVRCLTKKDRP